MTLQLAIGPVCLYIFTTASVGGFPGAEAGVAGVTVIDALYIALALAGVTRLLKRDGLKKIFGLSGAAVVALFGVKLIVDGIFHAPAGAGAIPSSTTIVGTFLMALVLTASNPLTIVVWTGVFAARLDSWEKKRGSPIVFAAGCLSATLLFLTAVAVLGGVFREKMPIRFVSLLNVTAGALFILYSIKQAAGHLRRPAGAHHC